MNNKKMLYTKKLTKPNVGSLKRLTNVSSLKRLTNKD